MEIRANLVVVQMQCWRINGRHQLHLTHLRGLKEGANHRLAPSLALLQCELDPAAREETPSDLPCQEEKEEDEVGNGGFLGCWEHVTSSYFGIMRAK